MISRRFPERAVAMAFSSGVETGSPRMTGWWHAPSSVIARSERDEAIQTRNNGAGSLRCARDDEKFGALVLILRKRKGP
jgi:hypothetical protein